MVPHWPGEPIQVGVFARSPQICNMYVGGTWWQGEYMYLQSILLIYAQLKDLEGLVAKISIQSNDLHGFV